jgi:acetoin utilization protein AcuB
MTREVVVVPPELGLDAAWRIMQRRRIRHLPVTHGGELVGILSDRDILVRSTLSDDGAVVVPPSTVGEAMTPSPVTCEPSTSVADVVRVMTERKIDSVPVVTPLGSLVGLVTSTDLLLLLIDFDEAKPLPFDFRIHEDPDAAQVS